MNYKTQIETKANIKICFNSVSKEINKWWGKTDNSTSKIGDEFSIFFGETEWRFRVKEYLPFEKITWHCIRANHAHGKMADIKEEWLNSEVNWNFIDNHGKTKISFVHIGLVPELNCFDVCKSGWDYFISTSLKNYLDTGEGNPQYD